MNEGNKALPFDQLPKKGSFQKIIAWYEKQPWLRAVVQAAYLGPADTLLAGIAAKRNQSRLDELLSNVTNRLSRLEESQLNQEFLRSEEFFEIFRTCVEAVTRSSSVEKRKIVAGYLAGTIERGIIRNLSQEIAEDLKQLQPLHLQIISALPKESGSEVGFNLPLTGLEEMPHGVYNKGLSDLLRYGFLHPISTSTLNVMGAGGASFETTEYVEIFKKEVLDTTRLQE